MAKIKMAICYDLDGTLAPGNMQEYGFTEKVGYANPKDFWKKAADIAKKQNENIDEAIDAFVSQIDTINIRIKNLKEKLELLESDGTSQSDI